MFIVSKDKGLEWQSAIDSNEPQSSWDEVTLQLRYITLHRRTAILCEPVPCWYGNEVEPRTAAAQLTAWNVLIEFQQMDLLETGYFANVSPTDSHGIKFEIVGWKDVVTVTCTKEGDISWRVYREKGKGGDEVERIGMGCIQAQANTAHPVASKTLRHHLEALLIPYAREEQT